MKAGGLKLDAAKTQKFSQGRENLLSWWCMVATKNGRAEEV